jgi:molecular chaperone Hsp33
MTYQDTLQRFLFENLPIRGEMIHLGESFESIVNLHLYPPRVRQLVGEALAAVGLLTAIFKFKGRVTIQFKGAGKLKLLLAQSNQDFQLRGLAQWEGDWTEGDVSLHDIFHQGVLAIILDGGEGKIHYQGVVSWQGNSLAESIEGYFRDSEQLDTKIKLVVGETSLAGLLLQIMPLDEGKSIFEQEALQPTWRHITELSSHIEPQDLLHLDNEQLLQKTYPEEAMRIFPAVTVEFRCSCSVERGENAILLFTKAEIEEELKLKQMISVLCEFCGKEYKFDRVDVESMFAKRDSLPPNTHLQ